MPIALLLQSTFAVYRKGSTLLDPWLAMVRIEELLIGRARSAFLVHWFGDRLPVRDNRLQVSIANLRALRQRWEAVTRQQPETDRGINLTEPLAGLAGTLVGVILSPAGAILGVHGAIRLLVTGVTEAGGLLAGLIAGPVATAVGAVVGVLLLPLGLALAALFGAAEQSALRELYRMLGAVAAPVAVVAGLLVAHRQPRTAIWFLASWLPMLIAMAVLPLMNYGVLPALPSVWVLPYGGLLQQLTALAFRGVIDAVVDTVRAILYRPLLGVPVETILKDGLGVLVRRGPAGRLGGLFGALAEALGGIPSRLGALVGSLLDILRASALGQMPSIIAQATNVLAAAVLALLRHPALRTILGAIGRVQTVLGALPPSPPSAPSPSSGSSLGRLPIGPPVPRPPSLPDTVDIQSFLGPAPSPGLPYGPAQIFPLAPETLAAALRMLGVRMPVFAGERARLVGELGQVSTAERVMQRAEDLRFRGLLEGVMGQVLPPDIAAGAPALGPGFAGIDRFVYGTGLHDLVREKLPLAIRAQVRTLLPLLEGLDEHIQGTPSPEQDRPLPVRALPDTDPARLLRVLVDAVGLPPTASETRRFAGQLVAALRGQTYLARAGGLPAARHLVGGRHRRRLRPALPRPIAFCGRPLYRDRQVADRTTKTGRAAGNGQPPVSGRAFRGRCTGGRDPPRPAPHPGAGRIARAWRDGGRVQPTISGRFRARGRSGPGGVAAAWPDRPDRDLPGYHPPLGAALRAAPAQGDELWTGCSSWPPPETRRSPSTSICIT